uniref:Uncharacterized protein n=1 Tax=Megaselia scalaris TaxID=36166 RepID=T1H056_MEGSC
MMGMKEAYSSKNTSMKNREDNGRQITIFKLMRADQWTTRNLDLEGIVVSARKREDIEIGKQVKARNGDIILKFGQGNVDIKEYNGQS